MVLEQSLINTRTEYPRCPDDKYYCLWLSEEETRIKYHYSLLKKCRSKRLLRSKGLLQLKHRIYWPVTIITLCKYHCLYSCTNFINTWTTKLAPSYFLTWKKCEILPSPESPWYMVKVPRMHATGEKYLFSSVSSLSFSLFCHHSPAQSYPTLTKKWYYKCRWVRNLHNLPKPLWPLWSVKFQAFSEHRYTNFNRSLVWMGEERHVAERVSWGNKFRVQYIQSTWSLVEFHIGSLEASSLWVYVPSPVYSRVACVACLTSQTNGEKKTVRSRVQTNERFPSIFPFFRLIFYLYSLNLFVFCIVFFHCYWAPPRICNFIMAGVRID